MAVEIRRLRKSDKRTGFTCGQPDLDYFFARFAGQNQFKHHIGVTWVAVEGETILGFSTVSMGTIGHDDLSAREQKRLPNYPIPVLRLARLGVSVDAQGRGIARELLWNVFRVALRMDEDAGCYAVVVDAKKGAVGFYKRYGFAHLGEIAEGSLLSYPSPAPMFLPIKTIINATKK